MALVAIILSFFILSFIVSQFSDNHPELDWQYFETEHFIFYFHEETERTAIEASKVAELIYKPVTDLYGFHPKTKTSVILKDVNDYGASRLIYTDINRDGMKLSPNFNETENVANNSNCPVIISGGVSSIDDIKKAKELGNKNIEGIIVGKAIYDGDIELDQLAKEIDA